MGRNLHILILKYIAKQKQKFPSFSIVLQNHQLLASLELINQFLWVFLAEYDIKNTRYKYAEN